MHLIASYSVTCNLKSCRVERLKKYNCVKNDEGDRKKNTDYNNLIEFLKLKSQLERTKKVQ